VEFRPIEDVVNESLNSIEGMMKTKQIVEGDLESIRKDLYRAQGAIQTIKMKAKPL
jgi:hypothetical protein